ncbi:MAG: glycosyltransferase family 9 protein [Planctomycetota bacterium]|jgi:lipopolysaccharide heptosyltransferase I
MAQGFNNILIIKPSSLGDIITALPVLSALRKNYPHARISWLVRPEFRQLLDGHPYLDEIIIFDRKFLGKALYNIKAFTAVIALIRKLRKGNFDIAFDLQGLFRTASLAWLSGCKKRFGPENAREFAGLFYTNKTIIDEKSMHVVDYYLKMIKEAGAQDVTAEFILPNTTKAENVTKQLLIDHRAQPQNYAVFAPGSAHTDKCWPTERFAKLADLISRNFGFSIVAAGTEAESRIIEEIDDSADVNIANLAGKTNIVGLTVLLKNAKFVISNDTGPGHIAAAMQIPMVMIFGRSNPNRVFPYNRSQCAVAIDIEGRGLLPDSTDPKHDIQNVTLEMVFEKVCQQLQ